MLPRWPTVRFRRSPALRRLYSLLSRSSSYNSISLSSLARCPFFFVPETSNLLLALFSERYYQDLYARLSSSAYAETPGSSWRCHLCFSLFLILFRVLALRFLVHSVQRTICTSLSSSFFSPFFLTYLIIRAFHLLRPRLLLPPFPFFITRARRIHDSSHPATPKRHQHRLT